MAAGQQCVACGNVGSGFWPVERGGKRFHVCRHCMKEAQTLLSLSDADATSLLVAKFLALRNPRRVGAARERFALLGLDVSWEEVDRELEALREAARRGRAVRQAGVGASVYPRIFVVADTHFGHAKIIEYERRPFRTVEQMDAALVARWNEVVNDDDVVWHLGDVSVCGAERTRELVRALRGRKHLVLGNHDVSRTVTFWKKAGFLEVLEGPVRLFDFLLTHEALAEVEEGLVNVHGHSHGSGRIADRWACVSVELTGYRPVRLKAVAALVSRFKQEGKKLDLADENHTTEEYFALRSGARDFDASNS